ncbi:MAG: helix-hairpin-helix domain-containing protein [Bacteroidales bacterium]|nr:helix-hairpin-helix domain-containing protein [Bacteroidales bacterium]
MKQLLFNIAIPNFYLQILFVFIVPIISFSEAFGQDDKVSLKEREDLISRIEQIAERSEQELDYTDLLDGLYQLLEDPVNLNYASIEELKQLFFLSDLQAYKLIEYRNMYGLFVSIYELQAIEGFDRLLIELMEPFVSVSQDKPEFKANFKNALKYGRHDIFLRYSRVLENQEGYKVLSDSAKLENPNGYYLGSPDRLYLRYAYNYKNKVRAGLTADKDAGEEFFKGSQPKGFDFYSAFAYASDLGVIKEIVAGDYHIEFGQGLTLWTGLAFGKSSDGVSVIKKQRHIRPNTSSNENLFLRGTAVTAGVGSFNLTGFFSSKFVDANIGDYDTLSQEIAFVTSLQETGYHRTNAEIADKHAIKETLYGGHLEYNRNSFRVGATAYKSMFDRPLEGNDQLYQKFDFAGNENLNYGMDYNFIVSRFNFFGEFSGSKNGGRAWLAGFQAALHPQLSVSVYYRDFGEKYQNLYSNAIGEGSTNQNEKGLYTGMRFDLHKNWTFTGYVDFYNFPWMRYRVDFPSKGREHLGQLEYRVSRDVAMYFRYRSERKETNLDTGENLKKIGETYKQSFRFNVSYSVIPSVILKNRFEYLQFKNVDRQTSNGFLIYQDVMYRPENKPYDLTLRYALFNTDDYDARIYAYENDVLYAFSIPGYYYNGSRFYVLLKWEILDNLDFWLRFSQTFYNHQTTIGSGLDEIDGNTRSEIKMQLRLRF